MLIKLFIFQTVSAEEKFSNLVGFLRKHHNEKILVFFSTCACVDYFSKALQRCGTLKYFAITALRFSELRYVQTSLTEVQCYMI